VIVRKFTVDAAQLPGEFSQGEETERNVGLGGISVFIVPESSSRSAPSL